MNRPLTSSTQPKRPAWLAPAVVSVLAVAVGAGLVVAIGRQNADTVRQVDAADATVADPAATTPSTDQPVDTAPTVTDPAVSTTPSEPTTTVESAPPVAGTARINGVSYVETYKCVAFPNSNPQAGVGDAHINVSLHQMTSVDGDRVSIERWNIDADQALGVYHLGGPGGRLDDVQPGAASHDVVLDDGSTATVELGELSAAQTCSTLVAQGADEFDFTSLGAVDLCTVDDSASDIPKALYTFDGGRTLLLEFGEIGSDAVTGTLRHADGVSTVTGMFDAAANGYSGELTPGLRTETDTFVFEVFVGLPDHRCLERQVAAAAA